MVVFATYHNNEKTISLIFVAADLEQISLVATQNDATSVRLETQNTARITFDPEALFAPLTPEAIESATTQIYQQQEVLFIHPHHNTALYEVLRPRIEASTRLEIQLPVQ